MNSSRKGKLNGLLIVGNKIQMLFFWLLRRFGG